MNGGQAAREALWFESRPDGKISCLLCPHACVIPAGGRGICRVRINQDGALRIPYYGRISALAVDPIEKKPLYHFHPGARILSAGFLGCSFRCRFCQNWQISQTTEGDTRYLSPSDLVDAAIRERSFGIAYTYSEPLIHAEYLLDAARETRAAGLKNVLVSNGFLNSGPAEEVLTLMDAANIDLKAYDDGFYRTETGGTLEDVKRFLAQAARLIHLEVTTLVIPSKNDDPGQIEGIARFISSLGVDIPLHLSAYHPDYRYEIPATPAATIKSLAEVAQRHLRYVYTGNLGAEQADTRCNKCGAVLVHRVGYSVRVEGVRNGSCAKCGGSVPIVGI